MSFSPRSSSSLLADLNVALAASADGRSIVRYVQPSQPFFLLGDTAWELFHRLEWSEAEVYLRNRASKGFNWVMAVLIAENDGHTKPDRRGNLPFIGETCDPTRPNPAYFDFVDRVIDFAASIGITIALVPTWGRFLNGGLANGPILFDETNAYTYGQFLGQRYPFQPFVLGGDTNRYWHMDAHRKIMNGEDPATFEVHDVRPVVEAMAKGLLDGVLVGKKRDGLPQIIEQYTPFITYHSTQGWLPHAPAPAMASAQFPDADWLTLDCVQSGHMDVHPFKSMNGSMWQASNSYLPVRTMYSTMRPNGKPRPVIDLEGHYEATHHAFNPANPIWGAADIRNGAWQAIFAGMHKVDPIAITAYTNWYHELDLPGAFQAGVIKQIMLTLPDYVSRVPDQTFITSATGETDSDRPAGNALVSGMRGSGWAMVCLPFGGHVELDVKKALPNCPGDFRAWWIDTKCGGKSLIGSYSTSDDVVRTFSSPTNGSKNEDWLLLLEHKWDSATCLE
ncbi:hypothetical protein V866_007945 [Kwoniella sp. B9012]